MINRVLNGSAKQQTQESEEESKEKEWKRVRV